MYNSLYNFSGMVIYFNDTDYTNDFYNDEFFKRGGLNLTASRKNDTNVEFAFTGIGNDLTNNSVA